MGLFELVRRSPGRDDVRLGDDVHELGAVITDLDGHQWRMVGTEPTESSFADSRYILLPVSKVAS